MSAYLGDRGRHWSDVNIGYLDSLVVADFKRLVDDLRRSLDSQTFSGATALAQTTPA